MLGPGVTPQPNAAGQEAAGKSPAGQKVAGNNAAGNNAAGESNATLLAESSDAADSGDDSSDESGDAATSGDTDGLPTGEEDYATATRVTRGSVATVDGTVDYVATTGVLRQADDDGDAKADVFFVAYTKPDVAAADRPVTFCFNGGPGSSSVWLHLGMLGPRRIEFPDDASFLKPPYRLTDNPHSLLSVTDLVFIDPVSTGFSRPTEDEKKSQFHGFEEDVRSVSQFIHDWTTRYQRWPSPKYLLGESYGGIRAAGVARRLQSRYNMELNGAVVISGAINFQTLRFYNNNDVAFITYLPTFAATAWYHGRLSDRYQNEPVDRVVADAEAFAAGEYATALLKGSSLKPEARESIAQRYAELTGLDATFVKRAQLRISQPRFCKELLRSSDQTVGRFDSRYRGRDRDSVGERYETDPSGSAIFGPFTAVMNHYLRDELNYRRAKPYEILTGAVQPWNYDNFNGRYVDASEDLRRVMTTNPFFKLYVACGYYDLATPHFAMRYTLDHMGLPDDRYDSIKIGNYEGGHMMYIHGPSMQRLYAELKAWYRD